MAPSTTSWFKGQSQSEACLPLAGIDLNSSYNGKPPRFESRGAQRYIIELIMIFVPFILRSTPVSNRQTGAHASLPHSEPGRTQVRQSYRVPSALQDQRTHSIGQPPFPFTFL